MSENIKPPTSNNTPTRPLKAIQHQEKSEQVLFPAKAKRRPKFSRTAIDEVINDSLITAYDALTHGLDYAPAIDAPSSNDCAKLAKAALHIGWRFIFGIQCLAPESIDT